MRGLGGNTWDGRSEVSRVLERLLRWDIPGVKSRVLCMPGRLARGHSRLYMERGAFLCLLYFSWSL